MEHRTVIFSCSSVKEIPYRINRRILSLSFPLNPHFAVSVSGNYRTLPFTTDHRKLAKTSLILDQRKNYCKKTTCVDLPTDSSDTVVDSCCMPRLWLS